ncbi:MAG: ATP-dependent DNA helicase RecG [Oscillospiraceae bacterium]|nr:ATP-dependent DNA helicase RecG [Oscillospiraceae bacterium]
MISFDTDIKYLKGVGEKRAELFRKLGIDTIGALLRFYPRGYEDWGNIVTAYDAPMEQIVCIKARIVSDINEKKVRQNMTVYRFSAADKSGEFSVVLFNNKYLANRLHKGSEYLFYGKLGGGVWSREMSSPEISEVSTAGIRPIYKAVHGLPSKTTERIMKNALAANIPEDPIPSKIREKYRLCELRFAIENIHFPRDKEALIRARKRLVFEELFILQTGLALLKTSKNKKTDYVIKNNCFDEFKGFLPYSLTSAQIKAVEDCLSDMMSGRLMNRLVEGDVGSGKTAVAAALCYITARNGYQAALMAPTEILAVQHYKNLSALLEQKGISCVLLTGSMSKKARLEALFSIVSGEASVIIGTHAIISESVEFKNLGLVVTDEQHRFGVAQRERLAEKSSSPHILVMSATPIPQTLSHVIYGDLDISIIDEYPKGRQKIESFCINGSIRKRAYNYIKKHLDEGRQGYIVCPLVEENEETKLISAEEYYKKITAPNGFFKDYKVGLLHGRMKAKEKDAVMKSFADGEIKLLVCTTVVEVGIDVPNAAIMVIENAERFGLSQLHQLRGRIGRGKHQSSCIFITDSTEPHTLKRLDVIKNNSDGFKIANEDLKLRGPGDFLGNRQHGLPRFNIADIFSDFETLKTAGVAAKELIEEDRSLALPENALLKEEISRLYKRLF